MTGNITSKVTVAIRNKVKTLENHQKWNHEIFPAYLIKFEIRNVNKHQRTKRIFFSQTSRRLFGQVCSDEKSETILAVCPGQLKNPFPFSLVITYPQVIQVVGTSCLFIGVQLVSIYNLNLHLDFANFTNIIHSGKESIFL